MTLRLSRLVPDGYNNWYYHEESGLLLHNNFEYGWTAVTNFEAVEDHLDELDEAVTAARETDGVVDPSEVLPLPDDYEHAEEPRWVDS